MARKNIKVGGETFRRHKRRKQHYGLSWEEYLDAGCPTLPEVEG